MKPNNDTILTPIDFSTKSLDTLKQSYHLACMFKTDITLLHVRQDTKKTHFFTLFSEEETEGMKSKYIDKIRDKLNILAEEAYKNYKIKVKTMLAKGRPFEKINEISEITNSKFIVIDRNTADGNTKNYIGTNTSRIIRESVRPVIILNNSNFEKGIKTIILPLDLTKETRQKVNKAIEIAKQCGSMIKVVSALLTGEDYVINHLQLQLKQVNKFIKESGVECTSELIKGSKSKDSLPSLILDYANKENGDLMIIMTQQEVGWINFFIGSTALEIIRNSEIPIMTLVPKDINFVIASL